MHFPLNARGEPLNQTIQTNLKRHELIILYYYIIYLLLPVSG